MMGYGNTGGGGWMWVFGGVMVLGVMILVGLAAWAVVTVTNRAQRAPTGAPAAGSPTNADVGGRERTRQLLDERYARGEMNTDDYTERLHTLGL